MAFEDTLYHAHEGVIFVIFPADVGGGDAAHFLNDVAHLRVAEFNSFELFLLQGAAGAVGNQFGFVFGDSGQDGDHKFISSGEVAKYDVDTGFHY